MAIKFHNPKSVALTGKYSLGVEVPADARLLFLAGQVATIPRAGWPPASRSSATSPGRTSARS